MQKNYDVISFDCYGTLIDWETGLLNTIREMIRNHGEHMDDDDILSTYSEAESYFQSENYRSYKSVLQHCVLSIGQLTGFIPDPKEEGLLIQSLIEWEPFEDVDILTKLGGEYKLGLISNTDNDLFLQTNMKLNFDFDYVVTSEDAKCYKPSLEIFKMAIKKFDVKPERILHVAQSKYHDLEPASKLGVQTMWLNRSVKNKQFGATPSAACKPDFEINSLKQIFDYLG